MKIGYKCIVKLYFTVADEKMKWYNQKHDPHNGKSAGEQIDIENRNRESYV